MSGGKKDVIEYNNHLRFFAPITTEYHKETLKAVKLEISKLTGGLTSYEGNGVWVHEDKLFSEPVEILDIWFKETDKLLCEINNILLKWGWDNHEKALGIEYNNTFRVIPINDISLVEPKSIIRIEGMVV